MSKYLSLLLGTNESVFGRMTAKFNGATAGANVDVRLSAEIRAGVSAKIQELGLDPNDTTGDELYHALTARAREDNNLLAQTVGIKNDADAPRIIQKMAGYFSKNPLAYEVWSLKRTALKKLLSEHVPHKTMKALHYRSADSMLKRESPAVVYTVAALIEGDSFKKKIITSIKHLGSSDFDLKQIEFVRFSPERWNDIKRLLKTPTVPVFSLPEANAVVIIPASAERTDTLALLIAALILHEIRHIKEHASYLKFHSLDTNLHHHLQTVAVKGKVEMFSINDQSVSWQHAHRLFARQPEGREYLEPHVSKTDLEWTSLEASLAGIDERLSFWIGSHLLGFVSDKSVISFHIIDVCLNAIFKTPAAESGKLFLQETIWDELMVRYLEVPPYSNLIERHMYKISDIKEDFLYD